MNLEKRYQLVKERIDNESVDLLAVSKKQSINKIQSLYALGHRMFGESYVQEAIDKINKLEGLNIQWHFIGPIQSNKTKNIAKYFNWVQSVDSLKILTRLNNQREKDLSKLNVLLQLKVGGEESKRGFESDELLSICTNYKQFDRLNIRGLMSIPAPAKNYEKLKAQFNICRETFVQMQQRVGVNSVDTLSMGMSSDLEVAIESGSTMVRVGTDVFGTRIG